MPAKSRDNRAVYSGQFCVFFLTSVMASINLLTYLSTQRHALSMVCTSLVVVLRAYTSEYFHDECYVQAPWSAPSKQNYCKCVPHSEFVHASSISEDHLGCSLTTMQYSYENCGGPMVYWQACPTTRLDEDVQMYDNNVKHADARFHTHMLSSTPQHRRLHRSTKS